MRYYCDAGRVIQFSGEPTTPCQQCATDLVTLSGNVVILCKQHWQELTDRIKKRIGPEEFARREYDAQQRAEMQQYEF